MNKIYTSMLNTHFIPYAANSYQPELVVRQAAQVLDQFRSLCDLSGVDHSINTLVTRTDYTRLAALLRARGSDKADKRHNYTPIYAELFSLLPTRPNILEVGMGTNNTRLVSAMSKRHRPGASLRAWRDYVKDASVFGADVDPNILIQENRIRTAWVDQLELKTLLGLKNKFGVDKFDIIIDDGLHAFGSGFNMLLFGLQALRSRGWIVIEDIHKNQMKDFVVLDRVIHALRLPVRTFHANPSGEISCNMYILQMN